MIQMDHQIQNQSQFDLKTVEEIADRLIADLQPYCDRIEIAGSVRRKKPNPKDLELVCITKKLAQHDLFGNVIYELPVKGFINEVNKFKKVKGDPDGRYTQRILSSGLKLDLFIVNALNWGYQFTIRTGSHLFSKKMAARWVQLGFKGLDGFLTKAGVIIPMNEEKELFELLKMDWVDPWDRI